MNFIEQNTSEVCNPGTAYFKSEEFRRSSSLVSEANPLENFISTTKKISFRTPFQKSQNDLPAIKPLTTATRKAFSSLDFVSTTLKAPTDGGAECRTPTKTFSPSISKIRKRITAQATL